MTFIFFSLLQEQKGIPPSMFKALIGRGHPEFSTMRQQVLISQYVTVYHRIPQYTTVHHSHSIPQYTTIYYSISQYTIVNHSISQYTTHTHTHTHTHKTVPACRMHKSSSSTCCQQLRKTSGLPQLLSTLLTALSSRCVLASE